MARCESGAAARIPQCWCIPSKFEGRISEDLTDIPEVKKPIATIGLLLMRSYVLSGDTAHYDKVIEGFEA